MAHHLVVTIESNQALTAERARVQAAGESFAATYGLTPSHVAAIWADSDNPLFDELNSALISACTEGWDKPSECPPFRVEAEGVIADDDVTFWVIQAYNEAKSYACGRQSDAYSFAERLDGSREVNLHTVEDLEDINLIADFAVGKRFDIALLAAEMAEDHRGA